MASKITIQVASTTSTIIFTASDASVANILTWFIEGWAGDMPSGLTTAQQNQWKLDTATQRIVDYVRSTARQNRLSDLRAGQASIDAQADADTIL